MIDLAMFAIMLVVSVSGILLGVERSGDKAGGLQGIWVHMHIATSVAFLVLMTAHLLLHIPYIKKLPRLLAGRRSHEERERVAKEGEPRWRGSRMSAGTR